MWTKLDSPFAIKKLLTAIDSFSDGILKQIHIKTEGQAGNTEARFVFGDLFGELKGVEIKCDRVVNLHLRPSQPGCDSIIFDGAILLTGDTITLSANFIGGPLKGPPDGKSTFIPARDFSDPDITVSAHSMAWRPINDSAVDALAGEAQS